MKLPAITKTKKTAISPIDADKHQMLVADVDAALAIADADERLIALVALRHTVDEMQATQLMTPSAARRESMLRNLGSGLLLSGAGALLPSVIGAMATGNPAFLLGMVWTAASVPLAFNGILSHMSYARLSWEEIYTQRRRVHGEIDALEGSITPQQLAQMQNLSGVLAASPKLKEAFELEAKRAAVLQTSAAPLALPTPQKMSPAVIRATKS